MKKQSMPLFTVVLLCICLMAGCSGNKKTDSTTDHAAETSVSQETETEAAESSGNQETESAESMTGKSGGESKNSNASQKLYEDFLAGKEKLDISRVDLQADVSVSYTPVLKPDETYAIDEFLTDFFADRAGYNDGDYSAGEVYYSYADCGQDGTDELILQFTSNMYNDEYNNIMVIKDVNGCLVLCAWFSDGYRAYNYINKYGVIGEGGSGGASDWFSSYYGIDENGDKYVIYDSEVCGPYNLYMGAGKNPGEEAEKLGVDDICITRYSFDAYPYDDYEDEHYIPFLKGNYYTFGKGYDMGNAEQGPELYQAGSSYAEFMNMVTDNWYTPEEMEKILKEKLAEKRLTEEQLPENDLSWTKVGDIVPQ